jgi:cyclopropane fatty-acyl-phospholipid synthase-like methyltransferase
MEDEDVMSCQASEDFDAIRRLYDIEMADNLRIHDMLYPDVFGSDEYIGQFSDNSATELLVMGQAMRLPPGSVVLDVGCGRGAVARFLSRSLGWRVIGIDLASVPVEHGRTASEFCEEACSVSLINDNVYNHDFGMNFDGVYGTGAFCHFDAQRLFTRCRQLLKPTGALAFMERVRIGAIALDDWTRLTGGWHCPSIYTAEEYRRLLQANGFSVGSVVDLTPSFRLWQKRSVEVRNQMKAEIVARSSLHYFQTSLRLAKFESDVTDGGGLGYVMVMANRVR